MSNEEPKIGKILNNFLDSQEIPLSIAGATNKQSLVPFDPLAQSLVKHAEYISPNLIKVIPPEHRALVYEELEKFRKLGAAEALHVDYADIEYVVIQFLLKNPESLQSFLACNIDETFFERKVAANMFKKIVEYHMNHPEVTSPNPDAIKLTLPGGDEFFLNYADFFRNLETLGDYDVNDLIKELIQHKKLILSSKTQELLEEHLLNKDVEGAASAIEEAQRALINLTADNSSDSLDLEKDLDYFQTLVNTPLPPASLINSGYLEIDKFTQGFQKGWMVLVAARPKVGKSRFLVNLAYNMMLQKQNTIVFSFDMSKVDYGKLLLSCASTINIYSVMLQRYTADEKILLDATFQRFRSKTFPLPLFIDAENGTTEKDILNRILLEEKRGGKKFDVVIVDPGSATASSKKYNRDDLEQGVVSKAFKSFAVKENKLFLIALHRNKESTKQLWKNQDTKGNGDSIARSDIWFQDCDIVFSLDPMQPSIPVDSDDPEKDTIQSIHFNMQARNAPSASFVLDVNYTRTKYFSPVTQIGWLNANDTSSQSNKNQPI